MTSFIRGDGKVYQTAIVENHTTAKLFAERLSVGGEVEALVTDLGYNDDGMKLFLEEQRQRLLNLAMTNDKTSHEIGLFVDTMRGLIPERGDESNMVEDTYEAAVLTRMKAATETASGGNTAEKYHQEIRTKLGYPDEQKKDEDEDEELVVVNQGNRGSNNDAAWKCPLTGTHLDNPVKNVVCGHVYSKEAIVGHLRCSKKCPVAGCDNKSVSLENLVPDVETQLRVRRQKRRSDAKRQRDLSQSLDLEDDEDDEGMLV